MTDKNNEEIKEVVIRGANTLKLESIAIILALLVQTGTGVWWAAKLDSRVQTLEQANSEGRRYTLARGVRAEANIEVNAQHISEIREEHKELLVTLKSIEKSIQQLVLENRTHTHRNGTP